ncbi:MAG: FAD-binding oxidoreductase, partial [Candidatus Zipacnadales bacterium]
MMDRAIIRAVEEAVHAGYPLDAEAVLIIELDGMAGGMDEQIRQVTEVCKRHGALRFEVAKDEAQRELLWRGRKGAFGAVARIAPNKIVTDIAVPRTVLPRVLAEVKEIGRRHGLEVGNVFHAGDGNLHPQLLFDDRYPEQLERVQAADKEIAKLAVAYGGVLSGEHGIGCQKRYAMPLMYAPQDLAAMRAMKAIFDPRGILNPDKILPEPTQEEVTLEPQRLKRALPNEGEFQVESYEEAAAALAEATMRGEVVTPVGGRTKIGNPEGLLLLSARPLRGLVDYDWENLTVTIQAGATVAELQQLLAEHGQFCPLSAPFAEAATIGGVVAANSNGPLRYGYGELRDVVLGVKWAAGTGQVYTSGSKTVKNVTGYDLKRLLVGSCGSLGLIVEVTFRTLPLPPTEETLVIRVREFARVCAIAEEVRTSHLLPCAIEAVNGPLWALVSQTLGHSDASPEGWRLLFSLRGYKADVNEMRDGITDIAGRQGEEEVAVWGHEVSAELWRSVAEAVRLVNSSYYALRVIVPSGRLQKPVSAALSCEGLPLVRVSMGTGNIHVIADANSPSPEAWAAYAQILRAAAEAEGGWLTVDAPSGGAEAFVPRRKPDRISEAIKAYFDPGVILPRIPS